MGIEIFFLDTLLGFDKIFHRIKHIRRKHDWHKYDTNANRGLFIYDNNANS